MKITPKFPSEICSVHPRGCLSTSCSNWWKASCTRCIRWIGSEVHPTLVGGLEHDWIMTFHRLGISSSQLTFIFFRGVGIPPTRNDWCSLVFVPRKEIWVNDQPWFVDIFLASIVIPSPTFRLTLETSQISSWKVIVQASIWRLCSGNDGGC